MSKLDNKKQIQVMPITGFPENLPDAQAVEDHVIATIEKNYARAGAFRIRTPLVERLNVLTAKGGDAIGKEMYGLRRISSSEDGSAAGVGLKFDLTVPVARYTAQHQSKLAFPFRRYQIDRVHRGERPQSGRYREFIQADFDVIGREKLSIATDAEPIALINDIFSELKIGNFIVRVNNRKILMGFFESMRLSPEQKQATLAIIDKADRGRDEVICRLRDIANIEGEIAKEIVRFVTMSVGSTDPTDVLNEFRLNETLSEGIDELSLVISSAQRLGVPPERLKVDLSVVRGLDYYTGTVYETALLDHLSLGSVCSGGRYDDLCGHFAKGCFPGVGISIGVSRLVTRMIEANVLETVDIFKRHVLVAKLSGEDQCYCLELGAKLRHAGIPTEIFFEDQSLGNQLKYAVRKGYGYVIIPGSDERRKNAVQVKDLGAGSQSEILETDLISFFTDLN